MQSLERTASGLCRQLLLLLPGATVESSQGTLEGTGLPLPQPVATSVGTAVLMQLRAIAVLVLLDKQDFLDLLVVLAVLDNHFL